MKSPMPAMISSLAFALALLALAAQPAVAQARRGTPARRPVVHRAPAAASSSAGWKRMYGDNTVTVSLDTTATRVRPDGSREVRLRWQYAADQRMEGGKRYRWMIERRRLQCDPPRSRPVAAVAYSSTDRVVSSFTTPESGLQYMNWSRRPPQSSGGRAFAAVCSAVTQR